MKIGDSCPTFTAINQKGDSVDMSDYLGKKNIIIYFYPKNETKVCTAQACSFRDSYEVFKDHNCEVFGVSGDSVESHKSFASNHRVPFTLLSDKDKSIRKRLGVPKDLLGLLPGRYTYIINDKGIIADIFHDMSNAQNHTDRALEILNIKK